MHHQWEQQGTEISRSEPVNAANWVTNFRAHTWCSPEKARGGDWAKGGGRREPAGSDSVRLSDQSPEIGDLGGRRELG